MYEIILSIHIITATTLVLLVIYTDHYGLSWLRGKLNVLDKNKIERLHKAIYLGIGIMLITGIYLFWPNKDYLMYVKEFWLKMLFVATLITNSFLISKLMPISFSKAFDLLSARERLPLYISGFISSLAWIATILMATKLGL